MSDTSSSATPYTYTITLLADAPTANSAGHYAPVPAWQVQGAFLLVQGDVYLISDANNNVVAAVHTFGTVITRNDVTSGNVGS